MIGGASAGWKSLMDWSDCHDVERRAGVLSGADVVVGTRVPPETIIAYAEDGYSAEEIVGEFFPSVPLDRARRILAFAQTHVPHPA